ncbi:MerR family DNA-binding transcriptional regulator [Paenibacillus psychroresistens]
MTIQEFALKTGLPPTTLRFYENKNLLLPACKRSRITLILCRSPSNT